ncbi:MAG: hypothetical protein ACON4W_09055 [Parvibaculales bacterium]
MTRIVTIIALLFASPSFATQKTPCLIVINTSMSYLEVEKAVQSCPSGSIADILGNHAYSVVSKVCRFDREIIQLKKAKSNDNNAPLEETEEWWACQVR